MPPVDDLSFTALKWLDVNYLLFNDQFKSNDKAIRTNEQSSSTYWQKQHVTVIRHQEGNNTSNERDFAVYARVSISLEGGRQMVLNYAH